MSQPDPTPEAQSAQSSGQVSDAVKGNWVDRLAPAATRPYLRLSRLDRPIGTWLLLLPCWWGLTLAMLSTRTASWFDLWIFVGCGIGACLMRGAGCTWNDITDRDIDGSVARTASRPIPSGQVSARQALAWAIAQSLVAFVILLTFNTAAIRLGILSLLPVAIYPFAKRFTWWPQIFLGIAFNWGALLAWTAHTGQLQPAAVQLYVAGMSWTLFYDTIYAHQDKEDDALIGVKSTARLFGDAATPRWLAWFMVITVALMGFAIIAAVPRGEILMLVLALAGPWAMGWHMMWQLRRLRLDDNDRLLTLFRSNRDAGLIPVLFFALALFA
jgi:4-hydroxybenzoate polyprenyltransferase